MPGYRRIAALPAIALLGLVPAALAGDNNQAHLVQTGWSVPLLGTTAGTGNAAEITQGGDDNHAGADGLALRQQGRDNTLVLLQAGSNNAVGLDSGGFVQRAATRTAAANSAAITQATSGNSVGSVAQSARHGLWAPASGNRLTISQDGGDDNRIGAVTQDRSIGSRSGNSAVLIQTGAGNQIAAVTQISVLAGAGSSDLNRIELGFVGSGNGTAALTGVAAASGAEAGHFVQDAGYGNVLALDVRGDHNVLGSRQSGVGNRIGAAGFLGPAVLTGDNMQIGAVQIGLDNALALAVTGDGNRIGSRQIGSDNSADVALIGHDNEVGLAQEGLFNTALFSAIGNANRIEARQLGSNNRAEVTQAGSGNSAGITQIGDSNTVTVAQ